MKLGIFMLVVGLLMAGLGVSFASLPSELMYDSCSYITDNITLLWCMLFMFSKGIITIGGGLAIGGIIKMIVKR